MKKSVTTEEKISQNEQITAEESSTADPLAPHRAAIDKIDAEILHLLNERAKEAKAIGDIKIASGDSEMYRPEREAQVLKSKMAANPGPIPDIDIARLFREIMSVCLSLEKPLNIAYLGPEGTFTEEATIKHFGGAAKRLPIRTIDEIFHAVESGKFDFGVVPIENSTEGAVNQTLDCFPTSNVYICGETELKIHQNLMSHESELQSIKTVYAHPQSLAQCRSWLDEYLPHAERIATNSNAGAVQRANNEPGTAALGGKQAAEVYGVPILEKNIEDNLTNSTRFLIIGTKRIPPSGNDKTTILVSANDRPGLLLHLIAPLSKYNITMTRIESRPSKNSNWSYIFFIDVLGHFEEHGLKLALKEIEEVSSFFKVLGSYPVALY